MVMGRRFGPNLIKKINIRQEMGFLETQCLNGIYGFQTGNSFVRVKFYFT